jgi:hypothetical protein
MNEIKYKKYLEKINFYIIPYKNNNINILQLGCYNKEVTQIFLNNLLNKKSHLTCIDSFVRDAKYIHDHDYHTFKNDFYNIINESNKIKQITIMEMHLINGLKELVNKKTFDIIFIDSSYERTNFIYEILLSWDLLNIDGIIIFDNFECTHLVNKELCPFFAIESFMLIYKKNYINITKNKKKFENMGYFEKKDEYNIFDNINDQIVLKKIPDTIINTNNKIDNLFNKILNYKKLSNIYHISNKKLVKLDWNIEYYTEEEENENKIIENEIIDIDIDIDIDIFNKLQEFILNRDDIKYIYYHILDINYFLQIKKINKNIFINYLNKYFKEFNNIKLEDILNIFMNSRQVSNITYYDEYSNLKNLENKKITILQTGSSLLKSNFTIDCSNFLETVYNKKIYYYQIYPTNKNNKNILNTTKNYTYLPNNINSYDDINNLMSIINKKIDFIYIKKPSVVHKTLKSTNFNDLYLLNNRYIYYLYIILINQKKGGNLVFNTYNIFTNIYYQIIYILNIYYENVSIITQRYNNNTLSISNNISIQCINFKGISTKELNNLKKICIDISKSNKNIKSIFRNNIKNDINKYTKILIYLLKRTLYNFKIKYLFIQKLPQLSTELKNNYIDLLFKKQFIYFFKNYTKIQKIEFTKCSCSEK